jgi:hypothetical protein
VNLKQVLVESPVCPVVEASRTDNGHDLIVRCHVASNNLSLQYSRICPFAYPAAVAWTEPRDFLTHSPLPGGDPVIIGRTALGVGRSFVSDGIGDSISTCADNPVRSLLPPYWHNVAGQLYVSI